MEIKFLIVFYKRLLLMSLFNVPKNLHSKWSGNNNMLCSGAKKYQLKFLISIKGSQTLKQSQWWDDAFSTHLSRFRFPFFVFAFSRQFLQASTHQAGINDIHYTTSTRIVLMFLVFLLFIRSDNSNGKLNDLFTVDMSHFVSGHFFL